MTSLRRAVAWATTLRVPWTSADIVTLSGNDPQGVRPYLARLARDGVLIHLDGESYRAGPKAPEWRKIKPKTEPGGGAKTYRAAKATRERLAQADWMAGRAGTALPDPPPLIAQEPSQTDTDRQEPPGAAMDRQTTPLTIDQAAIVLGVSRRTIERIMADKEIKFLRVRGCVRFRLSDLEAWLVKQEVATA